MVDAEPKFSSKPLHSHVSPLLLGDLTVEELLEKYKGAYASDFEAPSASGSKASSDSEVSGDEEEESEEDESDAESNTSSSGIKRLMGKIKGVLWK